MGRVFLGNAGGAGVHAMMQEGVKSKAEEFAHCIEEGVEVVDCACKCKTGSAGMVDLHFRCSPRCIFSNQLHAVCPLAVLQCLLVGTTG